MTRTLSGMLTAVVLLAACGGERREGTATRSDSARSDSIAGQTGVATPAPAESAAAPSSAARPAAPTDTGAKRSTPSQATAKPAAPKPATTPKPAAPPAPDTGKTAAATPGRDTSASGTTQQADQPLRDAYHQAPRDTVDQATYDGWKQFNLNCARCHGEDVMGTTIAPHLIMSLKPDGPINTKELFMQTVCAGRPAKGMPSWCALGMDMNKINDIYAYVKGRSDAKIGPGRPAVKPQG
jgi:mono/diheme cytochrome c family protein